MSWQEETACVVQRDTLWHWLGRTENPFISWVPSVLLPNLMSMFLLNRERRMVLRKMFTVLMLSRCTTNTWGLWIKTIKCAPTTQWGFKQRNGHQEFSPSYLREALQMPSFARQSLLTIFHVTNWHLMLIHKLVENFCGRMNLGRPRIHPLEARFTEHVPFNAKGRPKEQECAVCKAGGQVKRSSFMCPDCNVGLCVMPCFRAYHTK